MAILTQYKWKFEGHQFAGIDANVAHSEFESVRQSKSTGEVSAQEMVDYGKANPNSTWHKLCMCNKNDTDLADEMRRHRAADAMRNFREVKVELEEGKQEKVQKEIQVVYATSLDGNSYKPRNIVINNTIDMDFVTKQAWGLLEKWVDTYDIVTDPDLVAIRNIIMSKLP